MQTAVVDHRHNLTTRGVRCPLHRTDSASTHAVRSHRITLDVSDAGNATAVATCIAPAERWLLLVRTRRWGWSRYCCHVSLLVRRGRSTSAPPVWPPPRTFAAFAPFALPQWVQGHVGWGSSPILSQKPLHPCTWGLSHQTCLAGLGGW